MTARALESDHEGHLRALAVGGVDFIVIGGIAVMAHGFVRATADTDIIANPELVNLERLEAVLPGADPHRSRSGSPRSRRAPRGA